MDTRYCFGVSGGAGLNDNAFDLIFPQDFLSRTTLRRQPGDVISYPVNLVDIVIPAQLDDLTDMVLHLMQCGL